MKHVVSAVIAVALALPVAGNPEPNAAAGAAASSLPLSMQKAPTPPLCWVEHAQVQPAPKYRSSVAARMAAYVDPKVWSDASYRFGSEHLDAAKMRRACREVWTRRI